MNQSNDWEDAEDAFLALFCASDRLPCGTRYGFADGNRRFNAVRVTSPEALATIDWSAFRAEHGPHFAALDRALTLQLPEPLVPPEGWVSVGPAYEHVRTPIASFAAELPRDVRLRPCLIREDVIRFVEVSLPSQIPPHMRERLARMSIDRFHHASEAGRLRPFLYEERDAAIGTVAVLPFAAGHTVFALSVLPARRGEGHMKTIYAALTREIDGLLYGQIEDGLATLRYRSRVPGTERRARTRTFRPADDPRLAGP